MATEYTWNIVSINVFETFTDEQSNTRTDVVVEVAAALVGTDSAKTNAVTGSGPATGEVLQVVRLDVSDLTPFTDFSSVTETQIINWIEAALGLTVLTGQKNLVADRVIANATYPEMVMKPLDA
jgi:hypothetical protein